MAGLVAGHLVDGVVDGVQTQLLGLLSRLELAGGSTVLGVHAQLQVAKRLRRSTPGTLSITQNQLHMCNFSHAGIHQNLHPKLHTLGGKKYGNRKQRKCIPARKRHVGISLHLHAKRKESIKTGQ